MPLQPNFTDNQITHILDQALVYQCACPAQVCRTILGLKELYDYQMACIDRTETDRAVHQAIAFSAADAHAIMERCLKQILKIEGWDMDSLKMPEELRKLQEKLL